MDSSDYPSLGWLARASAQLALQNLQVLAIVDAHLDDFERLFRAATDGDWDAVLHASERLASRWNERIDEAVVRAARNVCQAVRRDPSGVQAAQSLSELLAACREAKLLRD